MRNLFRGRRYRALLLLIPLVAAMVAVGSGTANATPTQVGLGSATNFAILAGSGISDVPTSSITGNVGLSPTTGAAITGLTCAEVTGTTYTVDGAGPAPCAVNDPGLLTTARGDARTAFNATSALPGATPLTTDLAGQTLVAGLYSFGAGATNLSGTVTLNAQNDPNSVWIFQASSTLITSAGSTVSFSNIPSGTTAAQLACNVYWTVGSSATLNSATTFVGTILASASITLVGATGTTVTGRLFAANAAGNAGAVTLDHDTIIRPTCGVLPPGPVTTTTPPDTSPGSGSGSDTGSDTGATPPKFTG
jgi:hypothetical protein